MDADVPVRECRLVVLIEMWEHSNYAERDLAMPASGAVANGEQ